MHGDAVELSPVSPQEQEERPAYVAVRALPAPARPGEAERFGPIRLPIRMRPLEARLTPGILEELEAEPPLIIPPEQWEAVA